MLPLGNGVEVEEEDIGTKAFRAQLSQLFL
jgi:hypothetical protein